jgi:hypothetical protein
MSPKIRNADKILLHKQRITIASIVLTGPEGQIRFATRLKTGAGGINGTGTKLFGHLY